LEVRVKRGSFLRSLYDQVSVLRHPIPGLRERIEDLPALCRLLLTEHARTARREIPPLMPDGIAALRHYSWPGNIRELSNILLRAVLWFAGPLDGEAFRVLLSAETSPDELRLPIGSTLADAEKELILAALRANRTKTLTARQLGISRRTLYQKLARYRESGIAGGMP
jgi:DNA-binding NtrC family response regulator